MASILPTLRFIAAHELGSKRPVHAYCRFARWQVVSRLRKDVVFDWVEGAKLIVRNGMTGATGNIYCGLHEFSDMAFLLHLLRPGDLFVDVGANVGSYTVLASAVCGARSIALEPDPGSAEFLRRNVQVNRMYDRVAVMETAAGATTGSVQLTIGQDTTNKVVPEESAQTRKVSVQSLDELLVDEDPVLIKIDVEGYESEVLSGATDTLRKASLAAVIIETANEDIGAKMRQAGFQRSTYQPFDRRLAKCGAKEIHRSGSNVLFVRRDLVETRVATAQRRRVAGVYI